MAVPALTPSRAYQVAVMGSSPRACSVALAYQQSKACPVLALASLPTAEPCGENGHHRRPVDLIFTHVTGKVAATTAVPTKRRAPKAFSAILIQRPSNLTLMLLKNKTLAARTVSRT